MTKQQARQFEHSRKDSSHAPCPSNDHPLWYLLALGYSILYWVSGGKDMVTSLRFIKMGALVTLLSHVGWIYLQANWWGVFALDRIFVLVATSTVLLVDKNVRQKMLGLGRKTP